MVSVPGAALACSTETAPAPAALACCADRPAADCTCCELGGPDSAPLAQPSSYPASGASAATRTTLAASPHGCQCRAQEPASPAQRPAQRTAPERSETEHGGAVHFALAAPGRPTPRAVGLFPSHTPSPRTPLYLRISHLLI